MILYILSETKQGCSTENVSNMKPELKKTWLEMKHGSQEKKSYKETAIEESCLGNETIF